MSDLIDRQVAIDAIWDGTNYDIYTREVKECLEQLPSAQPERKTGRWIPCSERVPETCEQVLVAIKYSDDDDDYEVTIGEYWGEQDDPMESGWGGYGDGEVIAWMPLPEPYMEVEHEQVRKRL